MKLFILYIILTNSVFSNDYIYEDDVTTYGKRIELECDVKLNKISFNVDGIANSTILIKVLGNQKQNSIPTFNNEIYSQSIKLPKDRLNHIELDISKLILNQNNIFIIIETEDTRNKLVSSKNTKYTCVNEHAELYTNNIIKINGKWIIAKYDFNINVGIEKLEKIKRVFEEKLILDSIKTKFISIGYINEDNTLDILNGSNILLNKLGVFDTVRIQEENNIISSLILDMDNNSKEEIIHIIYNDSLHSYFLNIYKLVDFEVKLINSQNINLIGFTNYNILDFNRDGYFDIYINDIENGDVVLENTKSLSFEESSFNKRNQNIIKSKYITWNDFDEDNIEDYLIVRDRDYIFCNRNFEVENAKYIETGLTDIHSLPYIQNSNRERKVFQSIYNELNESFDLTEFSINSDFTASTRILDVNNTLIQNYISKDLNNDDKEDRLYLSNCECRHTLFEEEKALKLSDLQSNGGLINLTKSVLHEDIDNDGDLDLIGISNDKIYVFYNNMEAGNYVELKNNSKEIFSKVEYWVEGKPNVIYNSKNTWYNYQSSDKIIIPLTGRDKLDSVVGYNFDGKEIYRQSNIIKNSFLTIENTDIASEERDLKEYTCTTYPQPFVDKIIFELNNLEGKYIEISLYKLTGEEIAKVFRGNIVNNKEIIEFENETLRNIATGVYFYKLHYDGGILTGKLSKLK